jgi:hypothetical protein
MRGEHVEMVSATSILISTIFLFHFHGGVVQNGVQFVSAGVWYLGVL